MPKLAKELVFQGLNIDADLRRVTGNPDYGTDFNVVFDPEAAHIVLNAPWQKIVAFNNLADGVTPTPDLIAQVAKSNAPVAKYFVQYALPNEPMWDAIAAASVVDPSLIQSETVMRMDVEIMPGATYGVTRAWKEEMAPKNVGHVVHVVRQFDYSRFLANFVTQATR